MTLALTGHRYGSLVVMAEAPARSGRRRWLCRCDCGVEKVIGQTNLRHGKTQSCGCRKREVLLKRNTTSFPSRLYADPTTSTRNSVITSYKKSAKERGFEWSLTIDDCVRLFTAPCLYCGQLPSNTCQMYNGSGKPLPQYTYSGIDRQEPSQGYTTENTVSCCMTCNRAKFQMTAEQFLAWIRQVQQHLFGGELR